MIMLRTFWVWHKAEDGPDCEAAWSQPGVDNNPEGWEAEKQAVLDRHGDGIHSHREIEVRVDYDDVMRHWWPDAIEGRVVNG